METYKQTVKMTLKPGMAMYFIQNKGMFVLYLVILVLCGYDNRMVGKFCFMVAMIITLLLIYRYWYLTTVKWTITDKQLIAEKGVFTKDIQYVELYRVVDYSEKQSMLHMMMNIKDVIVYSGDRTTPYTLIYGIPATTELIFVLKYLVEQQKKEHKVYEVTNR